MAVNITLYFSLCVVRAWFSFALNTRNYNLLDMSSEKNQSTLVWYVRNKVLNNVFSLNNFLL